MKRRRLIALVGRARTGKHTFLRNYYDQHPEVERCFREWRSLESWGFHPYNQREMVQSLLWSEDTWYPDPFMFVTHSPYILDEMGWESAGDVIVFHREGNRFYRGPLSLNPEAEWARKTLELGEFWDAVGEEWIKDIKGTRV